ncbi:hypothetical protein AGMMS49579_01290 [Spirochaetia bacterium]|nr:hypothetical protein AGMMS49579_01290 [Spirochaetia bacterium]
MTSEKIKDDTNAPSAPFYQNYYPTIDDNNLKLNQINVKHDYLVHEGKTRNNIKNKYKKADKALFGIECFFVCTEVTLAAISFTVPIIAPVTAPLCLGLTIGNVACRYINKKVNDKINKHSNIEILAKSKSNSMNIKLSDALQNGIIEHNEFSKILMDVDNYENMKQELRNRYSNNPNSISKDLQQQLINRGRELASEEFKTALKKNLNL